MARLEIGRYSTWNPKFKLQNGRAGARVICMGLWIGIKKRVSFGIRVKI